MTTYKFTIWQESDGRDVASYGDYEAKTRNGATRALARMLVARGYPDAPGEVYGRDGRLRYTFASLHRHGQGTLSEPDNGELRLRVFRHRPKACLSKTATPKMTLPSRLQVSAGQLMTRV